MLHIVIRLNLNGTDNLLCWSDNMIRLVGSVCPKWPAHWWGNIGVNHQSSKETRSFENLLKAFMVLQRGQRVSIRIPVL